MAFLAATIKDIAGVTTTLLSVGALMATPERIVRYLQVFIVNFIFWLLVAKISNPNEKCNLSIFMHLRFRSQLQKSGGNLWLPVNISLY